MMASVIWSRVFITKGPVHACMCEKTSNVQHDQCCYCTINGNTIISLAPIYEESLKGPSTALILLQQLVLALFSTTLAESVYNSRCCLYSYIVVCVTVCVQQLATGMPFMQLSSKWWWALCDANLPCWTMGSLIGSPVINTKCNCSSPCRGLNHIKCSHHVLLSMCSLSLLLCQLWAHTGSLRREVVI